MTEVELHADDQPPRKMRVILSRECIIFATSESKRSIMTENIFDVVQDVSSRATADSIETITLAYRVGETRESVSIRGTADDLLAFQKNLFQILLDETPVLVRHAEPGKKVTESYTSVLLSVTAGNIKFSEEETASQVVLPRTELTEFKAGKDIINDTQHSLIWLYWVRDGNPSKTTVCFASPRLFNIFGRYIKSTLQLTTDEQTQRQQSVKILLVDDNADDLEMGSLFLKQQSDRFSITCATSAGEGLEHLAGNDTVDCIISDFSMPGMDGIEFLREVRENHPDVPFILYTGQGSEQVAKQAIIDDATDYVEKDIGTDQYTVLAERIWKAVG